MAIIISKLYMKKKTLWVFLLSISVMFFIFASESFAENTDKSTERRQNLSTLRLYEDCKAYLSDRKRDDHSCPMIIDIAIQSYVSGQMFILSTVKGMDEQRAIIQNTKNYIFNDLKCQPQDDPVLIYPMGAKTDEAVAKFLDGIGKHPDWLEKSPSQVIDNALLSFNCKKE